MMQIPLFTKFHVINIIGNCYISEAIP